MALGPTRRPVLPGMKQALAAPWNMEHRLPKFNQLEMISTFTYKPSLVSAISSYRGNRPTNRQRRLQYTAQELARSVMIMTARSLKRQREL